jgi:hypothetical protein
MRVVVAGSTRWTDAEVIRRELAKLPAGATVVHGDSPGADALAGELARELGLRVEPFRKETGDYRRYRRAAWQRLNERMLESGVQLVLAFHPELHEPGKARGSKHLIHLAQKRGIEVLGFTM